MPSYKNIDKYLAEIKDDSSKLLGLSIGSHQNVSPGTKIPKAGIVAPHSFPTQTLNHQLTKLFPKRRPGTSHPNAPRVSRIV